MSETAAPMEPAAPRQARPLAADIAWLALPFAVLAIVITWFLTADPLRYLGSEAPPVENVAFERTVLDDQGIHLLVRAGGSEPMRIAQIQVDDAYWIFTQRPAGPIPRGTSVWLDIPYPWVLAEAHAIRIVTHSGTTFDHDIAVAVPTPTPTAGFLWLQAILGIVVGIVPVAVGLLFYPALRNVGRSGMDFLLALTVGLLAFLAIDTAEEALELAAEAAAIFQGPMMVILAALGTFLVLMAVGRRRGVPSGVALATYIALGIGLHNLGEGLAIGAAFAAGAAGLGTFLVLGFALHNITEGIGIAAPMLKSRPPLWIFAALALLAGGPAVIGIWIGSLATAPHWSALFLAIGAGAILQVIVEVGAYLIRQHGKRLEVFLSPPVMAGLATGVAFMYATAALVKI